MRPEFIKEDITMSKFEQQAMKMADKKLDEKSIKDLTVYACIIIASILMHDGDHIRQAFNWTYSIPASLWALNLTVYVLPVISLFLARTGRFSATLVTAVAGVFASASFLILHLCGSFTGVWGIWNFSYFQLMEGVTYNGVFYQGVDTLSWIFLFEVPVLSIPSSIAAFRRYLKLKKEA